MMWVLFRLTLYPGYLGSQSRKVRYVTGDEKKELIKGKFTIKHHQIGFIIFIPFLVIDMVVASTLMSMGMMMMSPVMVSLPMKLMLFVLVDGWNLIVGSLVQTFAT